MNNLAFAEPMMETVEVRKMATLEETVRNEINTYLAQLNGNPPVNLYNIVIDAVEEPLLRAVMKYTNNNQVRAAKLLGIARGTLRARLKKYGLID